jgi:hypothetical protein
LNARVQKAERLQKARKSEKKHDCAWDGVPLMIAATYPKNRLEAVSEYQGR